MSDEKAIEFNLLDEKWIKVLDSRGVEREVSLLEVFRYAHEYRRLANELPTVDVAILRLLLAILYAVFSYVNADGQNEKLTTENAVNRWKGLWDKGEFPYEVIEEYLEHYRDRFYLFHPETPFYQVANLSSRKCTEYEAPKLIGDLSQSGNKPRLFLGRTSNETCNLSEAARWLLYINSFDDTAAKPSVRKTKDSDSTAMFSPGAGWLGKLGLVYINGNRLFNTLLLNFVLLDENNEVFADSKPIWEQNIRDGERIKIALPQGLAELYTLQSRRLLLKRRNNSVDGYFLLGGDAFEKENAFIEQMTLWRKNDKDFAPRRHNASKQFWRDFGPLVISENDSRPPGIIHWIEILSSINMTLDYRITAAGVQFGDKDFFVDDTYSDSLTVNSSLFTALGKNWQNRIVGVLGDTDEAVKVLGKLASDLALAEGQDEGERSRNLFPIRNSVREQAYFELDIPFRKWLASLDTTEGDDSLDISMIEWKRQAKKVIKGLADEMLSGISDSAFVGHNGKTAYEAEKWFNINLAKILDLPEKRDAKSEAEVSHE